MTEESIKEYLMDWTGLNGPQIRTLMLGMDEQQMKYLYEAVSSARDEAYDTGVEEGWEQARHAWR